MDPTVKNFKVAIAVTMFPNIVQTYILNQIVFFKKNDVLSLISADVDPQQKEIHSKVHKQHLLNDAAYLGAYNKSLFKQLLQLPLLQPGYLYRLLRIVFSATWFNYDAKYVVKALIRSREPRLFTTDIIHSHSLYNSYDHLYLKDLFSIPVIMTFHGLEPKSSKNLASHKVRAVLETCDAFFVNTHFAQDQLVSLGCNSSKIHIIPQGTDTDDFSYTEKTINTDEPIIILSVGRLSVEKGFHIAVEAVARAISKFPTLEYHIVGNGPEEEHLRKLIEKHGLGDRVKIFGTVSTETLADHYSRSHIFLLPSIDYKDGSHTETQGVVLQEAQSSGIPVIASRTGGIPEIIIDNETGLLFDEENIEQLVDAINSLIDDPSIYKNLCRQGKKSVEEKYSIEVIGNKLLNVYDMVINR